MIRFLLDIRQTIYRRLPYFMRFAEVLVWLDCLTSPLRFLQDTFFTFASVMRYEANFTGQKMYLERLLNELFDSQVFGIYIEDVDRIPRVFFNYVAEGNIENYLSYASETPPNSIYIGYQAEFVSQYDFTVYVPQSAYNAYLPQIVAKTNQFKLAGKNFNVVAY